MALRAFKLEKAKARGVAPAHERATPPDLFTAHVLLRPTNCCLPHPTNLCRPENLLFRPTKRYCCFGPTNLLHRFTLNKLLLLVKKLLHAAVLLAVATAAMVNKLAPPPPCCC